MQIAAMLMMLVGLVLGIGGGIWLLVLAFQEHWVWGLACLFIPCAALVFAIQHWDDAGKPFLIAVGGNALMGIAQVMLASQN